MKLSQVLTGLGVLAVATLGQSAIGQSGVVKSGVLKSGVVQSGVVQPAKSPEPVKIQGVLIDEKCSGDALSRVVGGSNVHLEGGILWAYTHTRKCALMPECQRSGYGIATHDNRFLKFDAAGNAKALALIRASNKEDDLEIEVTGDVQGDQMKLSSLKWE